MSFHLYRINEIYANADGSVQFVEMRVGNANGQSFWAGLTLSVTRGAEVHRFTFPSNLTSTATANTTVLIATQGFADLGVVRPDFIISAGFLFNTDARLDFAGVDAVSYAALPGDATLSIDRNGAPATNSPTNFARETGSISAAVNHAPELVQPLPDQSANEAQAFAFQVAATAFRDTDAGDVLSYRAAPADGSALPAWLGFDAATRSFSGTPAAGDGDSLTLSVFATDRQGLSARDDFVLAVSARPLLLGSPAADVLSGGAAAEVLRGQAGDDRLNGGGGDDGLEGGEGLDTALYVAAREAFTVDAGAAGVRGPEGNDTLAGIERIGFADVWLAFDLTGAAGFTAKLLGAVFGATSVANREYAGIGIGLLDRGMSAQDLAQLAINARLGAGATNADLVRLLYTNVVGSAPDGATTDLFVAEITSGHFTQASLTLFAADTALNTQQIDLVGLAQQGLAYLPYGG